MEELLTTLLQAVITAAVPILTAFGVQFLRQRAAAAAAATSNQTAQKYITEISEAVSTSVMYVSQTYVDTLKKSGTFTAENQKEAFTKAMDQAKSLLTAEASKFLNEAYGDLDEYLQAKIEAEIKRLK